MDLITTLCLAAAAVLATALCGWLGARPAMPSRKPRLVPWRLLMALAFVMAVAMLVHVVTLLRGT